MCALCSVWVKCIDLVSLDQHRAANLKLLDLGCAPFVLYGVKYIVLVSLEQHRLARPKCYRCAPVCQNGAQSGRVMCFDIGPRHQTRLESRIKKCTPHCICRVTDESQFRYQTHQVSAPHITFMRVPHSSGQCPTHCLHARATLIRSVPPILPSCACHTHQVSAPHITFMRVPHDLDGVKCIDLLSLVPFQTTTTRRRTRPPTRTQVTHP